MVGIPPSCGLKYFLGTTWPQKIASLSLNFPSSGAKVSQSPYPSHPNSSFWTTPPVFQQTPQLKVGIVLEDPNDAVGENYCAHGR